MSSFRLKVLVADDSAAVRGVFGEIAASSPIPFDVIQAVDGRQCVELLNRGGIHLAFIDVNMPNMSGMEAVGALRHGGDRTFVTIMSSVSSERRLQLARELKVYEYLAKPFAAADVIAILRTYCRISMPTKALIVDDSATVRRVIGKVLAASIFNIAVTEAGDGEAALAAWQHSHFDVVFLDCNMPGIDGLQTLARLMERDPATKVIMITGERNEARRELVLAHGACAFLYKPFYAEDIDRELHRVFGLRLPGLATTEPSGQSSAA